MPNVDWNGATDDGVKVDPHGCWIGAADDGVKVDPHGCWIGAADDGVKVDPHGCWIGAADDGVSGDEESDNILGSILDFFDFPMESLEEDGLVNDWDASKSQYLGPLPIDVLMDTPTITDSKLDVAPSVFMHRPVSLGKQQTYLFEDDAAGSCILRQNKSADTSTFQSRSPVSVLENSSSSLAEKSLHLHPKRTRSKRPPPSGPTPWFQLSPFFSTTFGSRTCITKERRKKLPRLPDSAGMAIYSPPSCDSSEPAVATPPRHIKKCTHCEITKTPQWREGPLGPKTLCNACGVRYRSGRLFPEYRPAASPTFVPSLHSNSHKKVIEMRNKGKHQVNKVEQQPSMSMSMSPQLEFIPASSYLFDPIC